MKPSPQLYLSSTAQLHLFIKGSKRLPMQKLTTPCFSLIKIWISILKSLVSFNNLKTSVSDNPVSLLKNIPTLSKYSPYSYSIASELISLIE